MNCQNLAQELLNKKEKWETSTKIIEGEPFYWLGREPLPALKIIFTHFDRNKILLENNEHFPLVLYFWAGEKFVEKSVEKFIRKFVFTDYDEEFVEKSVEKFIRKFVFTDCDEKSVEKSVEKFV